MEIALHCNNTTHKLTIWWWWQRISHSLCCWMKLHRILLCVLLLCFLLLRQRKNSVWIELWKAVNGPCPVTTTSPPSTKKTRVAFSTYDSVCKEMVWQSDDERLALHVDILHTYRSKHSWLVHCYSFTVRESIMPWKHHHNYYFFFHLRSMKIWWS